MFKGEQNAAFSQRRNGHTLSCICERMTDSGYDGSHTYRIMVKRSGWALWDYLLVLVVCFFTYLYVFGLASLASALPLSLLGMSFIFWAGRNRVEQEAVVVMPTLGIQLETVYWSKKVDRRFVSLDRIVTPVINEAVTPVTSYFYLALIVKEEKDLLLTFSHLKPSLAMLLSVWRSIQEALGTEAAMSLAQI